MSSMITVRIEDGSSPAYYKSVFLPYNKLSTKVLKKQIESLKEHWYTQVAITYIKEDIAP